MKRMLQWGLSLYFVLVAGNVFAKENLSVNVGEVRVFPAILMISLLVLFILVGVFSKAKDT
ncbi:MAG: cation acetate symporter, partial [Desulfuromonadaceae bacterium]|nr:cation acetate symporter [Desulfuromonadaceae bacterium]